MYKRPSRNAFMGGILIFFLIFCREHFNLVNEAQILSLLIPTKNITEYIFLKELSLLGAYHC